MMLHRVSALQENNIPLKMMEIPTPEPNEDEILVKISACGLCHTDMDEIEGRTPPTRFPMILGHQIVGTVVANGRKSDRFQIGERVGIAWIHSACGKCFHCKEGKENLCQHFAATGRDRPGGYAQYTTVREAFAHPIPQNFTDTQAAPLLCAGAVGYRSLVLTNISDEQVLGFYGFGASGHLVIQVVRFLYPRTRCYVFARNPVQQRFAMELGAVWAGGIDATPPTQMDAVIDTTPVWQPMVMALNHLKPGGRLVINAIRKEEIDKQWLLNLDYARHLWLEKEIKSVANVTRKDVSEFLQIASQIPIQPEVQTFSLVEANQGLMEIKNGKIKGAKVLLME